MIKRWCGTCKNWTNQTFDKEHWTCAICNTVMEDALGCKIEFVAKGEVVPKGRHRAVVQGGYARIYTPGSTAKYEQYIKMVAAEHAPPKLLTGALVITLHINLQRPASLPNKITHCIKRPDVDNSIKSILDALESVIYKNDSQIVELHAYKRYGTPSVKIEIEELES